MTQLYTHNSGDTIIWDELVSDGDRMHSMKFLIWHSLRIARQPNDVRTHFSNAFSYDSEQFKYYFAFLGVMSSSGVTSNGSSIALK